MDKGKDLAWAGARQTLANHDLEPPFLARGCIGGLYVAAVDSDSTERVTQRQPKLIEWLVQLRRLMSFRVKAPANGQMGFAASRRTEQDQVGAAVEPDLLLLKQLIKSLKPEPRTLPKSDLHWSMFGAAGWSVLDAG